MRWRKGFTTSSSALITISFGFCIDDEYIYEHDFLPTEFLPPVLKQAHDCFPTLENCLYISHVTNSKPCLPKAMLGNAYSILLFSPTPKQSPYLRISKERKQKKTRL